MVSPLRETQGFIFLYFIREQQNTCCRLPSKWHICDQQMLALDTVDCATSLETMRLFLRESISNLWGFGVRLTLFLWGNWRVLQHPTPPLILIIQERGELSSCSQLTTSTLQQEALMLSLFFVQCWLKTTLFKISFHMWCFRTLV